MLVALGGAGMGMVIDLSRVAVLDPVGITALVAGLQSARACSAGFSLASLSPACARALEAAGLQRSFPTEASVREAQLRLAEALPVAAAAEAPAR
jgi:anti-anti-sigma factor